MAKLEKLRTALESAQNASGKALDISGDIFPNELGEVKAFFSDVLSASALKIDKLLRKPLIDTSAEGQITVQGRAGLFDLPKVDLTLLFTEPTDDQIDVDATVGFPKGVAVKFGALPSFDLTSPDQDVILGLKKTGSTFNLNLVGKQGKPIQLPGLSAVAQLTEGANFADLLPASLVNIVNGIAFNELTAEFDPTNKTVSQLSTELQYLFGSDASGNWRLAPGVTIGGLRFLIEVENAVPPPGEQRTASGAAFGKLKIGNVQMPLEFRSANADAEFWTARIQEGETVVLPTLGGFLGKILDEETVASIPSQIVDIPGITINELALEFDPEKKTDPKEKTIKNFQFDLSLSSDWELVPGFLATQDNQLNFTFENLLDSVNRKIFGTASSSLVLAGAPFVFSLEKTAEEEQWTMNGNLADGKSLSLTALFNKFLNGFSIPSDLPDFAIDEASFSVELQSKKVTFRSASSEGVEIISGFGLSGIGIGFEHSPAATANAQAVTSASLTGTIVVAGIDLNLQAELVPASSGTGKKLKFETSTAIGSGIPIGQLVSSLAAFGDIEVPASIDSVSISDLTAVYVPDQELSFGFVTTLETDAKEVGATILLRMTKNQSGTYDKVFEGLIAVDDLEFDISFSQANASKSFYASLRPGALGEVSLSSLLTKFVDDPNGVIPEVNITLQEAFVSFSKPNPQAKGTMLFGVAVGIDMTFSDLPLVGPMLNGQTIGVDTVLFTYATSNLRLPDVRKLNLNLPKGKLKLPETDMQGGIGLSLSLAFGKLKQYIALPVAEQAPASPGTPPAPPAKPQRQAEGKWFSVNKRLGPVSIAKVGVNFKDSVLTFGLDASVSVGPLTLLLEEMTFGSPLNRFEPQVGLRGFGLEYIAGPVSVSGFFMRKPNEEYIGAALIKTPALTLKAVGAYAMTANGPSFFLYAFLGYPIGGPAFFFVEGIAVGFGFNRSVRVPTIDKVKPFPLVAIAIGDEPFLTIAKRMADGDFVPIDPGKLFLAVGVRFTTFKQLDSFLLIIATFGDSFRLDLLGLSKLVVPAPLPGVKAKTPLAVIELAIKGAFAPDEGFISVQAQLTKNSYILSKDCHLTGGFAFFTWFGNNTHAGDFVISLGGYHPDFKRPPHYPIVPRLGFNWTISSEIIVKGGMYFALTPSVVMAGGRLEATFRSGGLKAWFIIGADFIIGWKPFFYDAKLYLGMGVSYTFWFFGKQTISFDIGARLHIWGPEFSGTAYIDLGIVDFTIEFGAGSSQTPKPIRWPEFRDTFLPKENIATVAATSGLLKEIKFGDEDIWVVNPKDFLLTTDSVIPIKQVPELTDKNGNALPALQDIGIGTVAVQNGQLQTTHRIKIFKGSDDFTEEFIYEPVTKSYPAALWGDKLVADKNDKNRIIPNALSGMSIKSKPPGEPNQMGFLDQDEFRFQTLTIGNVFLERRGFGFTKSEDEVSVQGDHFVRDTLLGSLGFDPANDFEIDENTDFGFAEEPVVGKYASEGLVPS